MCKFLTFFFFKKAVKYKLNYTNLLCDATRERSGFSAHNHRHLQWPIITCGHWPLTLLLPHRGPFSPEQTLHTHCLRVFPVCSISASCALLNSEALRWETRHKKHSTSLCQGLKWRLLDSTETCCLYACPYKYTNTATNAAAQQSAFRKVAPRTRAIAFPHFSAS